MRILACADIHGREDVYGWLVSVALDRRPDLIVLGGDLFGFPEVFSSVESAQKAQGDEISTILSRAGLPVFYIMGNDDWIGWTSRSSLIQSIHGRRVECGAVNFVGYQFTTPFVGSPHEKPEEGIRADLDKLTPLIDLHTVLVTHGPSRRSLDWTSAGEFVGSSALAEFMASHQVRAHIHGHVHHAFGRDRNHFNVAAAGTRRAMLIDLDSMEHEIVTGGSVHRPY
jgi:Icc-related predicted phosphoesterase